MFVEKFTFFEKESYKKVLQKFCKRKESLLSIQKIFWSKKLIILNSKQINLLMIFKTKVSFFRVRAVRRTYSTTFWTY